MTIAIEECDHLNHSPGFDLAARGWAENVQRSFGPREALLHWSQKTLVAFRDGQPVGVIVWEKLDASREAWITLGYVHPDHRCHGVYTALYRRLIQVARAAGLRAVSGGVMANNETMRAVALRQGRRAVAITYSEEI